MNSTFGVQNTARKHGQPISGCCPFPWLVARKHSIGCIVHTLSFITFVSLKKLKSKKPGSRIGDCFPILSSAIPFELKSISYWLREGFQSYGF